MHNLETNDGSELNKSKPRTIKKFEKPPPLKIPGKAQPPNSTNSTFQDKVSVSTPVVEVTHSKNNVQCEKNLFKNESNVPAHSLKNNLSSIEDKYECSSGNVSNGSNIMPANRRLSSLMNRLQQLQMADKISQGELNLQNNLSSTNKNKPNEKSSYLNNKASSKSFGMNGSEDKNEMWSLSSTIWSPDVQVKSKEISCALSLEGTLILTNMYSGSLCSTKEYSKSTPLKTLNPVKNNDWELSKKIWSDVQTAHENNRLKESDKFSQSNSNGSIQNENGFSSEVKFANGCQLLEKENNLLQQKSETQFARQEVNQHNTNSTSNSMKKSRMSMLLDRLRSEAHSEQSSPVDSVPTVPQNLPPVKASTSTSSNPPSPCKSKSPSSTGSSPAKAASTSSKSSDVRQRGRCYNCGQEGHLFYNCPQPSIGKFCRRCGWEDVDTEKCPFCTGTLVRPGSTRPVPVGGDKCRKYPNIEFSDVRRQYDAEKTRRGMKPR